MLVRWAIYDEERLKAEQRNENERRPKRPPATRDKTITSREEDIQSIF